MRGGIVFVGPGGRILMLGQLLLVGIVAVEDPKIYRGDDRCLYVRGTGTSVFDAICFASKSNVLYSLGNHQPSLSSRLHGLVALDITSPLMFSVPFFFAVAMVFPCAYL